MLQKDKSELRERALKGKKYFELNTRLIYMLYVIETFPPKCWDL